MRLSGALCPALGPQHKDKDHLERVQIGGLEDLFCEEKLRELLFLNLEKKKALGGPSSSLPVPKGTTRELERDLSQGHAVTEQGRMVLNSKRAGLD